MVFWKEKTEDMKANLKMERSVEEVDLHFQMVKFMKENGKMIKKKE